jgi:hypothetical protein
MKGCPYGIDGMLGGNGIDVRTFSYFKFLARLTPELTKDYPNQLTIPSFVLQENLLLTNLWLRSQTCLVPRRATVQQFW